MYSMHLPIMSGARACWSHEPKSGIKLSVKLLHEIIFQIFLKNTILIRDSAMKIASFLRWIYLLEAVSSGEKPIFENNGCPTYLDSISNNLSLNWILIKVEVTIVTCESVKKTIVKYFWKSLNRRNCLCTIILSEVNQCKSIKVLTW